MLVKKQVSGQLEMSGGEGLRWMSNVGELQTAIKLGGCDLTV